LYWENYEKVGYNPIEQKEVITTRRRIKIDRELPMKGEYRDFIRKITAPISAIDNPSTIDSHL
jgi:tRNA(His) guanylyltransferase